MLIPDYSAAIAFSSGETAPANGIISGVVEYNAGVGRIRVNEVQVECWNAVGGVQYSWNVIVGKGDIITYETSNTVNFFPFKGAN